MPYQFKTVADTEGKVTLSGLPPSAELTILVLDFEPSEWRDKMAKWMDDLREDGHPFSEMDKDEIMRRLRKSREEVWKARYDR